MQLQRTLVALSLMLTVVAMNASSEAQTLDRTVLPIQEPTPPTYSELDARNVKAPPRFEVKARRLSPIFSQQNETADVGIDNQTPVALRIGSGAETRFTGRINEITLEVK